jgi:hypothetical protein
MNLDQSHSVEQTTLLQISTHSSTPGASNDISGAVVTEIRTFSLPLFKGTLLQ